MLFSLLLISAVAVIMLVQRMLHVCVCVHVSEFHSTCSIWPEAQSYLYSVGLLEAELLHTHAHTHTENHTGE